MSISKLIYEVPDEIKDIVMFAEILPASGWCQGDKDVSPVFFRTESFYKAALFE